MRLRYFLHSLLTGLPALAAELPDFDTCSQSEEPDVIVASCTRVIDDHTLAPQVRGAALFFRSLALETKRDFKGAMADLGEAIRIDPKPSHAHSSRARLYKEAGDDEHAFADLNAAIRIDPRVALFYNRRGLFYTEKNNYEFAVDDFNEAIRLDPQSPFGYWNRAQAHANASYRARAIADYSEVIRLDPEVAAGLCGARQHVPVAGRQRPRHRRLQ